MSRPRETVNDPYTWNPREIATRNQTDEDIRRQRQARRQALPIAVYLSIHPDHPDLQEWQKVCNGEPVFMADQESSVAILRLALASYVNHSAVVLRDVASLAVGTFLDLNEDRQAVFLPLVSASVEESNHYIPFDNDPLGGYNALASRLSPHGKEDAAITSILRAEAILRSLSPANQQVALNLLRSLSEEGNDA